MIKTAKFGWITLVLVTVLFLSSCTGTQTADSEVASSPTESTPADTTSQTESTNTDLPILEGRATVELSVNGSAVVIEVNGEQAPITAGNFVDLVQRGVYDGTVFHRVVRQPEPFVVQGGDPLSKDPNIPTQQLGTGSFTDPETGEARYIPLEIKPANAEQPVYSQTFEEAGITDAPELTHTRGAVAMARSQFPDSASAQFYIALADLPFLDGNYAVFGQVIEGMEVVDSIQQGDVIESAEVTEGLDNLKTGN
ncbi:peptidylprolyl isomerase [Almyronema epifaneia]|uniref:Peptidyl-prolyl cis-trans isomerase n=1 Tax=Almyronema epifaneia S1 TaxID=2991925 RepID=A0ABW6IH13_9CYAN